MPILTVLTFLPLLGAFIILALTIKKPESAASSILAHRIALLTSLLAFALGISLVYGFDHANGSMQFVERHQWLPSLGLFYIKGIDGISLWLVLLTTLLMPLCITVAFRVRERARSLMMLLLIMEAMILGVFTSLDLVLFYVFFESVLVPMFLMIGIWGGERRIQASFKFFLYTFAGSVFMLIAVVALIAQAGTSDMTIMAAKLAENRFPISIELLLGAAFFLSFAIKTPMWPFHTWLPWAHVEAPTVGSMILAGILLKMGGYGFIRVGLGILPDASAIAAPVVMTLSVIAIIYTSLVAFAQKDMKKLIAYSSVAHMGYVTLGIFAGTHDALQGAIFVMLSHGIVAPALFMGVGCLYERMHTRDIASYGGVASVMPKHATMFMLFTLAAIAVPGTSGFVGEFLVLLGTVQAAPIYAAFAVTGVVLGAVYMLGLYRRIFFGEAKKREVKALHDISLRDVSVFLPMAAIVIWMGVYPATFRNAVMPSVNTLLATARDYQRVTIKQQPQAALQQESLQQESPDQELQYHELEQQN